jgi:DNA-binding NtrC family response regulator
MTDTREVIVVEDNAAMRDFLYASVLASGYEAVVLESAHAAIKRYREFRPSAVILRLGSPRCTNELRTISVLNAIDPSVPVIVLSGHARPSVIVDAIARGASDFVSAPFDETDVELALAKALKQEHTGRGVSRQRHRGDEPTRPVLVGSSPAIAEVREFIKRAAATDVTVLLRGESGTGKTLVAREIVAASARRDKPFVKVNCAVPPDLLDAEMFGFAPDLLAAARPTLGGKFEFANHGTLFLNEVGEMSPALQAKLLKMLQEREYSRFDVSGHRDPLDVRLIAASSGDLGRAVAEGQLREELFFRLNVLTLQLPPLRERREDIPELMEHFLEMYSRQYGVPYRKVSDANLAFFHEHEWPGNVRELDNIIRRIVLLGTDAPLAAEIPLARRPALSESMVANESPSPATAEPSAPGSLKVRTRMAAREAERTLIFQTLDKTHGNRKEAAAILGISYKALLKKIKDTDRPDL